MAYCTYELPDLLRTELTRVGDGVGAREKIERGVNYLDVGKRVKLEANSDGNTGRGKTKSP